MSNATTIDALNGLLADGTVLYQKLRAMHWYVEGRGFFALHAKFEELYEKWADFIDEIAERILTIGGDPVPSLGQVLERSPIKELDGRMSSDDMVRMLVADLEHVIESARNAIQTAEKAGDRGTANLLDGICDDQEKAMWMLRAWLKH